MREIGFVTVLHVCMPLLCRDTGCQHSSITDFLAQLVGYIYQLEGSSVRISPHVISNIPGEFRGSEDWLDLSPSLP